MSAPPGLAPTTPIRRNHERRDPEVSVEQLERRAHEILAGAHIDRSPSWVSRTVRAFVDRGPRGLDFWSFFATRLALNEEQRRRLMNEYSRLGYSDPTGEQAAWNLDHGKRAGQP